MRFDFDNVLFSASKMEIDEQASCAESAFQGIIKKNGRGADYLGWVDLPSQVSENDLHALGQCAERLIQLSEIVVVVGIGGSYLGARAVIEAMQHNFRPLLKSHHPLVLYAGNNMSEDYMHDLLEVLDIKDYSLIVISKSGTTTEPALAFRILKEHCERKYGKAGACKRIVAVTDQIRGALKSMATQAGYDTFVIPDDVGGRYSVLTPVGLLPIAVAGFSTCRLIEGANMMRQQLLSSPTFVDNPAMQYAAVRNVLYRKGLKIELMTSFDPKLYFFIEWFKQLFGESEGKEQKGIFPAGAIFSTDLHSLGQYIQDGTKQLFETVLTVENAHYNVPIPVDAQDNDGLNYLQNRSINEINHIAQQGTCLAHVEGDVPNLKISIPEINEYYLGEMIYFFEFSCAISGYMLQVNPFDQPGVEAYKKNMFKLLGKPGA